MGYREHLTIDYAARLAPDGDPSYTHDSEGPDDMSAHIRSVFTLTAVTIPVAGRRCDLGTWQGVFLWEHRTSPHRRRISVHVRTATGAGGADRAHPDRGSCGRHARTRAGDGGSR